jgi:hypothetical protein
VLPETGGPASDTLTHPLCLLPQPVSHAMPEKLYTNINLGCNAWVTYSYVLSNQHE